MLGDKLFEPVTIQWNDKPFTVELEPTCYKGYDPNNVSIEDYFPDLRYDPGAKDDVPWDEIEKRHVLTLTGAELTLELHLLLDAPVVFVPSSVQSTGSGVGKYNGGAFTFRGDAYPILRCTVTATDAASKEQIEANRAALRHAASEVEAMEGGDGATAAAVKPQVDPPGGPAMGDHSESDEVLTELARHKELLDGIYAFILQSSALGKMAVPSGARGASHNPRRRSPKKRDSRAWAIQEVKKLLREHLRAARDHAYTTQDRNGVPELLPRPTQGHLAEQLKVSTSSISRAIRDEADKETLILWQAANNVDQVMKFNG